MKLLSYAQSSHDLGLLREAGCDEVILGHRDFCRFGKLSDADFAHLAARARELGLKVIFEWDVLMTENDFIDLANKISAHSFDVLRVQDPGALEWALRETSFPLQFIAENGNHNAEALKGWVAHANRRLERIVLSIELPKDKIEEYCRTLGTPCELLGFGRILLFYTPRSLLRPLVDDRLVFNEDIQAIGESEESPHKGFPIVENRHGTFMFHIKEFCLIDYARELAESGLHVLRVDLRWSGLSYLSTIRDLVQSYNQTAFDAFRREYPQDLMKGFYLVNKTDVLFPKLKNHRLQNRQGNYLGEVLEAEKGSHLAVFIKNARGLRRTDQLRIVHPEGKEFIISIHSLRNLALEEVDAIPAQSTALIPFVGGVWPKSHVFLVDDSLN